MKEDEKMTSMEYISHQILLVYKINGNETAGHVARKGADRNET
jgi:hypothetical protein